MKNHTARLFLFAAALALFSGRAYTGEHISSLEEVLPAPAEIEGWTADGELLVYGADNLWEYIDGAAENFLAYEFEQMIAQAYVSTATGQGLKVEVYHQGSPLMAFGIYSQFRDPGAIFYAVGNEAFGDPYSLHFWKGSCYVKIDVYEGGKALAGAMMTFAKAVAARMPYAGEVPPEISYFHPEGLIERSEMFVTEGVLGRGRFPPAFIARYEYETGEGSVYLFALEEGTKAAELFDWYTGVVGASVHQRTVNDRTYLAAFGEAKYRGTVGVFRYGRFMGVLTGFGGSVEAMEQLIGGTVDRVAEMSGRS